MSTYSTRTPRPHGQRLDPTPSQLTPASQHLNTISEGASSHDTSPRSTRRPPGFGRMHNAVNTRRSHLVAPPLESDEKPPPSYSQLSGQGGSANSNSTHHDKTLLGRTKRLFTGRGGWKRAALILFLPLLVLLVLAVGLGVGLSKKHDHDDAGGSGSSADTSQQFPRGNWSFPVVLATVGTSCTSNSATWTCFPYYTFQESPSLSNYTFDWTIFQQDPKTKNQDSLQIASSANPFSLTFGPTPLVHVDNGTPNERYTFSLLLPKQVQPTQSLTDDNEQTLCFYNQSTLAGSLYIGKGASATTTSNMAPVNWPGTAYIAYTSPGGENTPDCYRQVAGKAQGSAIDARLTPQAASQQCSCIYESNNGTTSST